MKIGIVTSHRFPTDQEIRVTKLAEALTAARHKVVVIGPGTPGDLSNEDLSGGYRARRLVRPRRILGRLATTVVPVNPVWALWLWRIVRAERFDVLIARDLRLTLPAIVACRLLGIPLVLDIGEHYPAMMEVLGKTTLAHHITRNNFLISQLERLSVQYANWVWVVVEENARRLSHYSRNIEVISNYPTTRAPELGRLSGQGHRADGRTIKIVSLGIIDRIRGLDLAIKGFAQIVDTHPLAELVIYGDGPERPSLMAQASALGIADRVHFPGWVKASDKEAVLSDGAIGLLLHSVCALCQHTIPNKLFDYMAAGIPIVSTHLGPIARVIEKEGCGVLVDEDPHAVAIALAALLDDPDARRQMGEAGRRAVGARYQWELEADRAIRRLELLTTHG